jgi:hemoglobin-like flavoprotein
LFSLSKGDMESEQFKPLSSNQIELLKKTFRALDTDSLSKRFYTKLFLKHPEVRPLFPTDLTELSTKLISVFELVIFSFHEQSPNKFLLQKDVLIPLRTLGKKHMDKGVENLYYPIANEILINSIKEEVGPLFSPEAEVAWKLAFQHLTTAMLSKDSSAEASPNTGSLRETFIYIKSLLFKS